MAHGDAHQAGDRACWEQMEGSPLQLSLVICENKYAHFTQACSEGAETFAVTDPGSTPNP